MEFVHGPNHCAGRRRSKAMSIRNVFFWMAIGSVVTLSVSYLSQQKTSASAAAPVVASAPRVIAASPGRVEGASEPIEVGAAADGVIESVTVKEGQFVERGAVMARIACPDLEAEMRQAIAERDAAAQRRERLLAGSRPEERALAAQKVETAKAV